MWKESFVALVCLGFIVAFAQQEYSFDEDVNSPVTEKSKDTGINPSKSTLIFNSDSVTVDPGQRLQLDCGVQGEFRNCFWEKEGAGKQTIQVEDVHEGRLKGLSKPDSVKGNECGIVISSVSAADHGKWTCKVFVVGDALTGSKKVVVTVKPQPPSLDINESPLVVTENEEKEISCTVPAARPPARIRWFVGTEDITVGSRAETVPTDDEGTYKSVSILKYKFHHGYDRQGLRCSIEHPTLQEPEYAEVQLDIRYSPYPISSNKIYGIPMDSEYEIKYNFTSNPRPEMSWQINDLVIPVPGKEGRYTTEIKDYMDNVYMASLRISDFSSDDVLLTYKFHTKNDLGERNFDITLSTGPAPPDGDYEGSSDEIIASSNPLQSEDSVGSGTIAAIIAIVVFIIILLFIIGMMRYRQMYCFAPKDRIKNHLKDSGENLKEEHSDTESAREPKTKGKASNLLKNISTLIKPKKAQKEPRLDKIEEGEAREDKGTNEDTEGKSSNTNEVVYAELTLNKNEQDTTNDKKRVPESTEYAEIVGTVPVRDNRAMEKKE